MDNWGQLKAIFGSTVQAGENFGEFIALSGDILVVGAPGDRAVYVFEKDFGGGDNWGQAKRIVTSVESVAVFGDIIAVGDVNAASGGTVCLYQRDLGGSSNWGLLKTVTDSGPATDDRFGVSVALSGDTLAVGAMLDDTPEIDSGSVYVFERDIGGTDNWGEAFKLTAVDTAAGDRFGAVVSIDGDILAVSAPADDDYGEQSGSAYIFQRVDNGDGSWDLLRKITAADGAVDDLFGNAVAVNGDLVLVGAAESDANGSSSGAAYLFARNAGGIDNWGLLKKIAPQDGNSGDYFGMAVAASDDTLLVGAYRDDENGFANGSAYLFSSDQGGVDQWGQVRKLLPVAMSELPSDYFGISTAIYGDRAVVGADNSRDYYGAGYGSAYVFEMNHGGTSNWGQVRRIGAYDLGAAGDRFGLSVGIWEDLVVVGAPYDDDNGTNSGSIYIFDRNRTGSDGWGYDRVKKITPADGTSGDFFGISVAICHDTVVVGAYGDDDMASGAGSAYVFERHLGGTDNWGLATKLTAPDADNGDDFGSAVAIMADTIVIGARDDDDQGASSGAAYVFEPELGSTEWTLTKKLTASDGQGYDYFGYAVSICIDQILVGAYGDDDKGSGAGAAYLFNRNAGGTDNWGEVLKMTAADGAAGDAFGRSVSITFDNAVVGANNDDDLGANAGAAYVFQRDEPTSNQWSEIQKLTPNDLLAGDTFGGAVAIFGNTAVVGASTQDEFGSNAGGAYIFSSEPMVQSDLVVQDMTVQPSTPEVGQPMTVTVTIQNQGWEDSGLFMIDWYADQAVTPSAGQQGDVREPVTALGANQTLVLQIAHTYLSAGNYQLYAQVDTDNQEAEADENNNIRGPLAIVVGMCEGNTDGDSDVDGSDLAVFAADFGRTDCDVGDPCEGDFDTDNDVDGSDLAVFAADFGRTDCPTP
jgi:hypothetical protein